MGGLSTEAVIGEMKGIFVSDSSPQFSLRIFQSFTE